MLKPETLFARKSSKKSPEKSARVQGFSRSFIAQRHKAAAKFAKRKFLVFFARPFFAPLREELLY